MNMKMKMFRKRIVVGCLCGVVLIGIVVFNGSGNDLIQRVVVPLFGSMPVEDISCYTRPSTLGSINTFSPDDALKIIKENKPSIFFHETSCFNDGNEINLTCRELCAVESAARMNKNMTVYLFVLSHSNLSSLTRQSMLRLSSVYKNIVINRILIDDYIRDSPLEKWWASGALKKSQWPRSHASDVLRYLTLWKFGGIYLDLDVVVTSSLESLTNFAGAENWEDVAAGVIGFSKSTRLGRKIADACIEDLRDNFRGDNWGNNGPGVITRTLQKLCATKYARDMTTSRCRGFTVTPASAFYPIHYKKWKLYFDTKEKNSTMDKIKKSFAIHVWNKFSKSEPIKVGSDVPYALVANKYCPNIYKNCGTIF